MLFPVDIIMFGYSLIINGSIIVMQHMKMVSIIMMVLSLTSCATKLVAMVGLWSRRRWLLVPYMTCLGSVMGTTVILLSSFPSFLSGILVLILIFIPSTSSLMMVSNGVNTIFILNVFQVLGSWLELSHPAVWPGHPEGGNIPARPATSDSPPSYEDVLRLVDKDQELPTYEEAVASHASAVLPSP